MRYYFNIGLNICANEKWVADYLFMGGMCESREEAVEELHSKREVYGWFDCELKD